MRNETDTEDEAPLEGLGRIARWRQALASAALRMIDAMSGVLSRARNRLALEAGDADEPGEGRRKPQPHSGEAAAQQVAGPQKPRRLVQFLVIVLVLIVGTAAGAAFSYRLLSKTINANGVTIEHLRDELAELKKQGSLDQKQIARSQQMIRDYDKSAAGYLKELEDSRAEVEELRNQLSVAKTVRKETPGPSRNIRSSPPPTAADNRPVPRKAGICTMDSAKDAANLASCIEQFNRK